MLVLPWWLRINPRAVVIVFCGAANATRRQIINACKVLTQCAHSAGLPFAGCGSMLAAGCDNQAARFRTAQAPDDMAWYVNTDMGLP
jgi:hypothetical protein